MHLAKVRKAIGDELTGWFTYGVVLSLLPLIAHFIFAYLHAPRAPGVLKTLTSVVADGELLLIACCIGAGALGEHIGKASIWPRVESISAGLCIIAVFCSAIVYGILGGVVGRKSVVPEVSVGLVCFTVFASAVLMWETLNRRDDGV